MEVFKFIWIMARPYRAFFVVNFIVSALIALIHVFTPILTGKLVDKVTANQFDDLPTLFMLIIAVELSSITCWTFYDFFFARVAASFKLRVGQHFMERLYQKPYSFFQGELQGSLSAKMTDAFQNIFALAGSLGYPYFFLVILILSSLTLLLSIAPIFALLAFLWVSFFISMTFWGTKRISKLETEVSGERAKVIGQLSDYVSNILNVKIFSNKKYELERYHQLKPSYQKVGNRMGLLYTKFYALQGFFCSAFNISVIYFLIEGYRLGNLSAGDFVRVIMTNVYLISTLFQLSHQFRETVGLWGSARQALKLIDGTQELVPYSPPLVLAKGEIKFRDLVFSYPESGPLFEALNLEIKGGQKVGLVGYSGGGKSSFVNLLLGMHKPEKGEILIDGQNINAHSLESLREQIAMIPQDPLLFHRSLMDNIRYGKVEASDQEVIEAARKAEAHDFITSIPMGYQAMVGERGVKLSGGQKQRIAIARAILKNAPILILDEATSQLDTLTESNIQDQIGKILSQSTAIVIAHRLSTLLQMDRILVFDKGKIIEDGTHQELLSQKGLYHKLWYAQSLRA